MFSLICGFRKPLHFFFFPLPAAFFLETLPGVQTQASWTHFSNKNSHLIKQIQTNLCFFLNWRFWGVLFMLDLKFRDPISRTTCRYNIQSVLALLSWGVSKGKQVCWLVWKTYQGIWDTSCTLLQNTGLCCQQNCALIETKLKERGKI